MAKKQGSDKKVKRAPQVRLPKRKSKAEWLQQRELEFKGLGKKTLRVYDETGRTGHFLCPHEGEFMQDGKLVKYGGKIFIAPFTIGKDGKMYWQPKITQRGAGKKPLIEYPSLRVEDGVVQKLAEAMLEMVGIPTPKFVTEFKDRIWDDSVKLKPEKAGGKQNGTDLSKIINDIGV